MSVCCGSLKRSTNIAGWSKSSSMIASSRLLATSGGRSLPFTWITIRPTLRWVSVIVVLPLQQRQRLDDQHHARAQTQRIGDPVEIGQVAPLIGIAIFL